MAGLVPAIYVFLAFSATKTWMPGTSFGHCTADEVSDALRREIETAGVNYVLTRFAFGNLSLEEELRSATLFAREMMPRFAREALPA